MEINNGLKICAGIVTFNPDIDRLKENYSYIANQVDSVVICDNGSQTINEIRSILIAEQDHLIELEKNEGIAFALNKLCEYAYKKGYKWILTLDQDSVCPPKMIHILSQLCSDSVAIIGPRVIYKGNEEYSAKYQKRIENVDWVITSGSLTNVEIWKRIKGFDNGFFIDKVDTDYCIRAKQAGFKVIKDNQIILDHELGKMNCKRIFGRVIYVTNHNEKRVYYQIRNSILLKRKTGYGKPLMDITKTLLKVVMFEKKKIRKIRSIIKGIIRGRKDIV